MAQCLDDSYTEFNEMEQEVKSALTEVKNYTEAVANVLPIIESLTRRVEDLDEEYYTLQGTMDQFIKTPVNTQTQNVSTIHPPHTSHNPFITHIQQDNKSITHIQENDTS